MSEPSRLKLRTTIMLVSMIALPAAAVMGVKWPAFLRWDRAWTNEKSSSSISSLKRAGADARADRGPPTSSPTSTTGFGATAMAGAQRNSSDPSGYPVTQAKNIDVRSATDDVVVPVDGVVEPRASSVDLTSAVASHPLEVQTNEEFTLIQQRLRSLGATHYVLETWGPTGDAYRFQCRMAAGHDAHYSRHFEATDVEPLRAMRTVLTEVESWKSGRLP